MSSGLSRTGLLLSGALISMLNVPLVRSALQPSRFGSYLAHAARRPSAFMAAGAYHGAGSVIRPLGTKSARKAKQNADPDAPLTAAQLKAKENELQADRLKKVKTMEAAGHTPFATTYATSHTAADIEQQ